MTCSSVKPAMASVEQNYRVAVSGTLATHTKTLSSRHTSTHILSPQHHMSHKNVMTIRASSPTATWNAVTYLSFISLLGTLFLSSLNLSNVFAKPHNEDTQPEQMNWSENNKYQQHSGTDPLQLASVFRDDEHPNYFYEEASNETFMQEMQANGQTVHVLPPVEPHGPVFLDMPYDDINGCDSYGMSGTPNRNCYDNLWAPRPWCWQILPNNLIYTSYLAGPKEPRLATVWYDDTGPSPIPGRGGEQNGWLWDSTLGGRVSILRYGSDTELHPQGFEVQVEGAAFVRLDPEDDRDLRSADYRFGIPLVYGIGRWQTKLAYYHNSAHIGDEFYEKYNPPFQRVNYVRDVIVLGNSYYMYDWLRLYGEVGWSFFNSGGSEPWEFQFGTELIQARPTGIRGAPFFAVNGMTRQELNWGGNVCAQVGWAWRGYQSEKLFRLGFEYLYGSDPQYEFTKTDAATGRITALNQNRAGIGMWYDF